MEQEQLEERLRLHKLWLEGHEDGVKANLEGANLEGVNLRGADLYGANLEGVNLRGADLREVDLRGVDIERAKLNYCIGNYKQIKTIQTETYHIAYTDKVMAIGCEQHTIEEWFNFNDEIIDNMDTGTSLEWWSKWKPRLQDIILNP